MWDMNENEVWGTRWTQELTADIWYMGVVSKQVWDFSTSENIVNFWYTKFEAW